MRAVGGGGAARSRDRISTLTVSVPGTVLTIQQLPSHLTHRSRRGGALLPPIFQMSRQVQETKGLAGIAQLVRGRARLWP